MERKNFYKSILIIFAVSLFLELFVFNFRFYTTLNNDEINCKILNFSSGISIKENSHGKTIISLSSDDENAIEITNINEEIDNIYIDMENVSSSLDKRRTSYTIAATDEANALYFNLPSRDVVCDVEKSKYINLHLSGKSEKIKIIFNDCDKENFILNEIKLNARYPMFFSFVRLIAVFIIILSVYCVRRKSPFYKYTLNLKLYGQRIITGIIVLAHIAAFVYISQLHPFFVDPPNNQHQQYHRLAEAIMEGHVYLDTRPGETLKSMDNPYDTNLRKEVMEEAKESYLWDRAYYNGKYYVYFGIVPVLTMYLPFKAYTGMDFSTSIGVAICASLLIFAVLGLVNQIIKRWFKNVPFIFYILLSFFFVDSCGIIYMVKRPDFYSVPIIMSLLLSVSGLYFWLSSFKLNVKNEKDETKTEGFNARRLFAGSLCMAMVAGCRPQVLLGSFLALPIFWNAVFKERKLFSKESVKNTVYFCLPYVIIACGIMYYNYIRFDSVFDFGANYNLTTNDMTKRGIVLGRSFLGIFMYLFQPAVYSPRFPFISDVWFYTNYMGTTIHEYMFGGIFVNHIILVLNLFVFKFKNILKKKGLFAFTILAVLFGFIIVIADTQLAGLLYRYIVDFSWLFFISAIILVLCIFENAEDNLKKYLHTAFLVFLAFSFYYDFATVFFNGDLALNTGNPTFFYTIAHLVQFWL